MANMSENRPGEGWLGVDVETSPLSLNPGSFTEARDVVIRNNSVVERRAGYQSRSNIGGADVESTNREFPIFALNLYRRATRPGFNRDARFTDRIMASLLNTATGFYILADEVPQSSGGTLLVSSERNHWGYDALNAFAGTNYPLDTAQEGLNMGDPRIVNGIFTTQNSPGVLLEEPIIATEYTFGEAASENQQYDLRSAPLGVPSVAYLEANALASPVVTDLWYESDRINSWAYRGVMKIGDLEGAPTPREIFVTPRLPNLTVTGVTTHNSSQINVAVSTPGYNHGLQVGSIVEIKGSSDPLWVGRWSVASVQSATAFTIRVDRTVTTTQTISAWRHAVQMNVVMYRPKEQAWSGHLNEAIFSTTHTSGLIFFTDYHTRVFFQRGLFELYRTRVTSSTVQLGAQDPGDEMFRVAATSSDTFRGDPGVNWSDDDSQLTLTYLDRVPESQLDKFLYTNPSQAGIIGANDMPPSAMVHENFKSTMFWANTRERAVLNFTINVPIRERFAIFVDPDAAPNSDASGYPVIFTPGAAENISGLTFQSTGGGATTSGNPAQDIENCARSLVRIINANRALPLKARYVSSWNDPPGKIEIQYLDYHSGSLSLSYGPMGELTTDQTIIRAAAPSAAPTYPSGAAGTMGTNVPTIVVYKTRKTNRVYWSKTQVPGATPRSNFFDLPDDVEIIGLRATSQGLYVITNSGIWMISGATAPWDLREFDLGAKCWAQGSIATLADTLFVLTTQGVQMYGRGDIISDPVNPLILPLIERITGANTMNTVFSQTGEKVWITSVVDELNQEYQLMLPRVNGSGSQMLRYSLKTGTWTTTNRDFTSGLYNKGDFDALGFGGLFSNVMIYGDNELRAIVQEKKPSDPFFQSDELIAFLPSQVDSWDERNNGDGTWTYFGIPSASDRFNNVMAAGDFFAIQYLDPVGNFLDVVPLEILEFEPIIVNTEEVFTWTTQGRITQPAEPHVIIFARASVPRIEFAPFAGGDNTTVKRWITTHLNLNNNLREVTVEFHTDQHRQPTKFKVTVDNPEDGWGSAGWGEGSWGDEIDSPLPNIKTLVPRQYQMDRNLTLAVEGTGFNQDLKIQSLSIDFNGISKRGR